MFGLMDSAAFHDATQTLRDVIFPQSKGPSHLSLPDWNDTPGRTKDEVLAPFDDAIGRLTRATKMSKPKALMWEDEILDGDKALAFNNAIANLAPNAHGENA